MVQKIVADTNVLISALGWNGNERKIIRLAIDGRVKLVFSRETFEELINVMGYPKFDFSEDQKARFILILSAIGYFVEISKRLDIIQEDPSDNRFLETALAGGASHMVSGDKHLLAITDFEGITILSATNFLKSMREKE